MRKNLIRCFVFVLIAAFAASFSLALTACNKTSPEEKVYAVSTEGLLENPDRGFRGEAYITLGRNVAYPSGNIDPYDSLDEELARYPENVKIIQQYVYLTDFCSGEISEEAFGQLKTYFEYLKEHDVRILLRFAYEYENVGFGPTTERIEAHAAQIKAWITANRALFDDVVYAVQLGMIGLWGEGHTSVNEIDVPRVIAAVADMIPEQYTIMVRYFRIYSEIPENLRYRFGIHEDWLVGELSSYDYYSIASLLEKNVEDTIAHALHSVNDGEMPWGRTCDDVDAVALLAQLRDYSLTTMSIAHCYIEDGLDNAYSLYDYKSVILDEETLSENGLPYLGALLEDGKISAFDYIRYHLGYLVTLDKAEIKDGKTYLTLTNHGLAAPAGFALRGVKADGSYVNAEYALNELVQGSTVTVELNSDEISGLNFYCKSNPSVTFRLASQMKYENGVNIL